MKFLTRTRGQWDSWRQILLRIASCLLDRKQRQKKTPVDILQKLNDPLDSLPTMMSWQSGGQGCPEDLPLSGITYHRYGSRSRVADDIRRPRIVLWTPLSRFSLL